MLHDVFAVYDSAAEAYLPPFILHNENMAKRAFADCVNSDSHQFGLNPADYTLFRLGQFDDSNAQFLLERAKQSLGNGVEFRSIDRPRSPELDKANGENYSPTQIHEDPPLLSDSEC